MIIREATEPFNQFLIGSARPEAEGALGISW
jgi:hypothetical protein